MNTRQDIRASRWLLLGLLVLAYACSGTDRQFITLVVGPIRARFGLGDAQIGLLQGIAFIAVYSVAGLPAGWLIDRVTRVRMVALAIVVWSVMTALGGIATSFIFLAASRAGVALGEAVLTPVAYSLIGDGFDKRHHGLAISLYHGLGGFCSALALTAGGNILRGLEVVRPPGHGLQAWQLALAFLGLPGVLLGIGFLALKEPARGHVATAASPAEPGALRTFYRKNLPFIVCHHLALGLAGMAVVSAITWFPAFMVRTHHISSAGTGTIAGLSLLITSLGLMGSGVLSDMLRSRTRLGRLLVPALGAAGACAAAAILPLTGDPNIAIAAYLAINLFGAGPYGAVTAALMDITPAYARGMVAAVYFMAFNLSSAAGPVVTGALSDALGLGPALLAVMPAAFAASALLYWLASRGLKSVPAQIPQPVAA